MGRSLRTALGSWFLTGDADDVAFKACKAARRRTPQGEAFSLRDVLRIAHPAADGERRRTLFGWIAGNVSDDEARDVLPSVDRFLTAKAVTSAGQAVRVVTEARGIVVLTDDETWAGRSHPSQALTHYRRSVSPDARTVVAAMTAAGYTIGDPKDDGVINVVGLDASLPMVVNGFVRS